MQFRSVALPVSRVTRHEDTLSYLLVDHTKEKLSECLWQRVHQRTQEQALNIGVVTNSPRSSCWVSELKRLMWYWSERDASVSSKARGASLELVVSL
jgi:hypothetical protein